MPTSAHFIYIPAIFIIGIVLGFIMGAKATRDAFALEQKKADERAARKAAREANRQAEATAQAGTASDQKVPPTRPPPAKES